MPQDGKDEPNRAPLMAGNQPGLFPARITTRYPSNPIGKDYAFLCEAGNDGTFHCKSDSFNKPVRANEWFAQSLARELLISVPEFRVIEDADGETFFGSREIISTALKFDIAQYLLRPQMDEIGRASEWLGRYLSGLTVVDLFLNNPDRTTSNFVFVPEGTTRRLCAIDFADVELKDLSGDRFPIATSNTMRHGKLLRNVHGFFVESAFEMIDRIEAVSRSLVEGIFRGMPYEWMAGDQQNEIIDVWASDKKTARLSALRDRISDGSLR